MTLKRRFFLLIVYGAFLSCLFPAAIYIYKHPAYNFDMLGYMALVVKMDRQHSIDEIHEITYSSARQNIPEDAYQKLTDTISYRKKFATQPAEFSKIFPNYIIKPLYTWLCRIFYTNGISLPLATVLPSVISYLFLGLFLFHWLSKYIQTGIAFLGGLLLMSSTFITSIARLSTPDCLSALFLFIAFYFILERRNIPLMFILFLLSILARVDNVIACFFIISFLTFSKEWKRITVKQFLLMTVLLAGTYLLIVLPVRQFGWSLFYYTQYARHIDYSRDFDVPVSLSSYFSLIYSKLVTAFVSTHFTFFAFLGLLVFINKKFAFKKLSFDQSFLFVLALIGLFKFILLPDLSDRFYFGFYLLIIILLVRKLFPQTLIARDEDR